MLSKSMLPLKKRPSLPWIVMAAIWAAMFSAVAREILGSYELFSIGAFQLSALDPAVVLTIAAIAVLLRRTRLPLTWLSLLLLAFIAIVALKLGRGLPFYGLDAIIALRVIAPVP